MGRSLSSGQELIGIGCWLLVVGCWLLVVGCWLLVSGRFSANGFPRIVFREENDVPISSFNVCV